MSELKPCPFCGGEAECIENYNRFYEVQDVFVKCKKCRACSIRVSGSATISSKSVETARKVVADAWNRRVKE